MLNETFTVIFKHRVVMMMLKLLVGATCRNETYTEGESGVEGMPTPGRLPHMVTQRKMSGKLGLKRITFLVMCIVSTIYFAYYVHHA